MDPSLLTQYGALGVLTLSAVSVSAVLWKRLSNHQDGLSSLRDAHTAKIETLSREHAKHIEELSSEHAERLEAIAAEHKAEMKALMERLIESHQSQMREYHKLTENMTTVLDSMSRKFTSNQPRSRTTG